MEIRTGDQSSETQDIEWDKVVGSDGYRLTCEIADVDTISASVPAAARWWSVEALGAGQTESATYFAPPELATAVSLAITFGATVAAQNPEVRGAVSQAFTFGATTNAQTTNRNISITAPSDGATITTDETTFLAAPSDPDNVDYVELYVNDTLIATEQTAPYGFGGADGVPDLDLGSYANGTITFKAKAVWVDGESAQTTHTCTLSRPFRIILPFTFSVATVGTVNSAELGETDWGYIPDVPVGWTLVEDQTISTIAAGASQIYYRNCDVSVFFTGGQSDLIFVDCDMRGGFGAYGHDISLYRCLLGNRVDGDGAHIRPNTQGATRPSGWTFQGCSILDITRSPGSTFHSDGIQFGGCLNMVVRHCYFNNIAVEHGVCGNFNGIPENVLLEGNYFGTRTDSAGPAWHLNPGSANPGIINVDAVNNYAGGDALETTQSGTSGVSETGTQPLSAWPHGHPTQANPELLGY